MIKKHLDNLEMELLRLYSRKELIEDITQFDAMLCPGFVMPLILIIVAMLNLSLLLRLVTGVFFCVLCYTIFYAVITRRRISPILKNISELQEHIELRKKDDVGW